MNNPNTVSIGYYREDGDFAVVVTLNNNDGIYTPETFNKLIKNIFNELYTECDICYPDLIVLERQDTPDYVQIDD
jgi:hypothetical protein